MQPSPLQLLQCSFESVQVTGVPDFDNSGRDPAFLMNPAGLQLSSETAVQDLNTSPDFTDYAIRFVVAFEPKEANGIPYRGEVVIQAQVRMHGVDDALERKRLAVVNGVSLLYGVARDMVSTVTSRGVHGQMLLPTLNFRSLADSVLADEMVESPPVVADDHCRDAGKTVAVKKAPKKRASTLRGPAKSTVQA